MLFYFLIISLAIFAAYISQRLRGYEGSGNLSKTPSALFLFISFLTLFIVSGFRRNVGTDYITYGDWFRRIAAGEASYFEPGFRLINTMIAAFTSNAQWIFITSSFITLGLIFYTIKKRSMYPALSVLLFCNLSFLFYSFNATRQFIAIGITLYAWQYLVSRKARKYLLLIILAAMFHKTALIMIPVYFIVDFKYKKIHYILITGLALATIHFKEFLLNIMITLYPMYANTQYLLKEPALSEIFITTTILLGILIAAMIKKKTISIDDPEIRISVNMVFLSAIMHTLLAWVPVINRLSLYVDISLILIIPLIFSRVRTKSWRFVLIAAVIIYSSLYTYISVGMHNSHNVLPYDSVLIEKRK